MRFRHTFYNASAGSGKTFKLCSRYISLLLNGASASEILTITFTNKAANEMKSRITNYLYALYLYFSKGKSALDSKQIENKEKILKELEKAEYNLSESYIKANIEKVYFDFLSADKKISTIDAFFNMLLRKFAFFIGMNKDFEIDVNAHNFNDFLKKAYLDSKFITIMRFLQQDLDLKLQDGGYKNTLNLENMLEELYDKSLEFKDSRDFDKKLSSKYILEDSKDLIEKNGFNFAENDIDSIKNKMMESMENLAKILQDFINTKPNKNIEKIINNLKSYDYNKILTLINSGSNHGHIDKSIKDSAIRQSIDFESKTLNDLCIIYETYLESLKLQTIHALIEYYKNTIESNQKLTNNLTFKDVEHKVFDIITNRLSADSKADSKDFNADYFYFRLDSNISHILFDECQDTSIIQYRIFKPLFDEFKSQDSGKSLFFVGDSKQSLYAFRGASSEVFRASQAGLNIENLPDNYRSGKNLIDFVHKNFYEKLKENAEFKCKIFKDYTEDYAKKPNYKNEKIKESFVNVDILESNGSAKEIKENCVNVALKKLEYLLQKGVKTSDILIVARKKVTLESMIESARNKGCNVEFNLENADNLANQKITKIIACIFKYIKYHNKIQYLESSKKNLDSILKDSFKTQELLSEINADSKDSINIDSINYRILSLKNFQKLQQKILNKLMGNSYSDDIKINVDLDSKDTLARKIKNIIESYKLYNKEYVQDCMNLLQIASENPQINDFESLLEILESATSTHAKEHAITMLTIHKSKGLEYDFVIYVDVGEFDDKNKLFYEYNGIYLDSIRLKRNKFLSKKLENLKLLAEKKHKKEELNVMYVACTRAKMGLYIVADSKSTLATTLNLTNADSKGDVESTLNENNKSNEDSNIDPEIISNIITSSGLQSEFETQEENNDLILQDIKTKQKQIDGLAMHLMFELLLGYKQSRENAENIVLSKYGFYLSNEKIEKIYNDVQDFLSKEFQKDLIQKFNFKNSLVKCELSFLQNNNGKISSKRIDSVIYDSNKFYILEFKSTINLDSKLEKEHKEQLENYINFAKNMFKDSNSNSHNNGIEPQNSKDIESKIDIKGFLIYPEQKEKIRELKS